MKLGFEPFEFSPTVCFKGGGGGGSSGAVSYPPYLEDTHSDWLDKSGTKYVTKSVTDLINESLDSSPFTTAIAYNPETDITAYEAKLEAFAAILAGITDTTSWASLYSQAIISLGAPTDLVIPDRTIANISVADMSDTADVSGITEAIISADVTAFADQLDDEISTKVLPRFKRGMQDINAVVSSAFPIGVSIIEGFRNREVAKHSSAIRLSAANKNTDIGIQNEQLHLEVGKANLSKNIEVGKSNLSKDIELAKVNTMKDVEIGTFNIKTDSEYVRMYLEGTQQILKLMIQRISWEEVYAKTFIESKRIKIVSKAEEKEKNIAFDEEDALWNLKLFQYGANLMAAPGGGTATNLGSKTSLAQSAVGGALSGAAAGYMVGGTTGAAVGSVLGAASAFL